jgi:hypothetical protein
MRIPLDVNILPTWSGRGAPLNIMYFMCSIFLTYVSFWDNSANRWGIARLASGSMGYLDQCFIKTFHGKKWRRTSCYVHFIDILRRHRERRIRRQKDRYRVQFERPIDIQLHTHDTGRRHGGDEFGVLQKWLADLVASGDIDVRYVVCEVLLCK